MHFKAVEAHLKQNGRLPVNMKFLIEGEEEVGSANLDNFISAHKDLLKADVVVITDSPMFDRGIPSICYGLRGPGLLPDRSARHEDRSPLRIVRRRGRESRHGARADPRADEGQERPHQDPRLLRRCRRAAAGGAGGVREAAVQREEIPAGAGRAEAVRRDRLHDARAHLGAADLRGQRPALGIHRRGRQDRAPAVAMAKVSMRLVPNQDPKKIGDLFEAYMQKVAPKTVELKLTRMHGGKPWMTAFDNPFVQAAGRAIEKGFGQRPVFNREGGSIPVVATFQEELGLPCVLFGVGLPDENAHAPDEKLDLGNFHNGIIASAFLYGEIGALGASEFKFRQTLARARR